MTTNGEENAERYRSKEEMREHFEQIVRERGLEQCVADLDAANKKFIEGVEKLYAPVRELNARFIEWFESNQRRMR